MEPTTRWGKQTRVHDADRGREILLNAALICIGRHGLKSTTMQKIAEEAHISRRTVHRYFHSKQELISEVTMYIENKTFLNIENKARHFEDDFFSYLEEAIVLGVSGLTVVEDFKSRVRIAEKTEDDEECHEEEGCAFHDEQFKRWVNLLRKPYHNHMKARAGSVGDLASLAIYAEMAILLVTGHYQLQSPEIRIRESFRDLSALAQRHSELSRNRSPHSSTALPWSDSPSIKSIFSK